MLCMLRPGPYFARGWVRALRHTGSAQPRALDQELTICGMHGWCSQQQGQTQQGITRNAAAEAGSPGPLGALLQVTGGKQKPMV